MTRDVAAATRHQQMIEGGLTGEWLRVYIDGALPAGWHADGRARVMRDLQAQERGELTAVVFVSASNADGTRHAGAKLRVDLSKPPDLAEMGAEASMQIREMIARHGAKAAIRFALDPGAKQPTRGSDGASGYDLHALGDVYLNPGQVIVVDTGVRIELPNDTLEAQVRPRSGMTKRGLWCALGTVDSDYRGPIGATIANLSRDGQQLKAGDRIAQLVICRVDHRPWQLVEVAELGATQRGTRGWGSTGQ